MHTPIRTAVIDDRLVPQRQDLPAQAHASGSLAVGRVDLGFSAQMCQLLRRGQVPRACHLLRRDLAGEAVFMHHDRDKFCVITYGCAEQIGSVLRGLSRGLVFAIWTSRHRKTSSEPVSWTVRCVFHAYLIEDILLRESFKRAA